MPLDLSCPPFLGTEDPFPGTEQVWLPLLGSPTVSMVPADKDRVLDLSFAFSHQTVTHVLIPTPGLSHTLFLPQTYRVAPHELPWCQHMLRASGEPHEGHRGQRLVPRGEKSKWTSLNKPHLSVNQKSQKEKVMLRARGGQDSPGAKGGKA